MPVLASSSRADGYEPVARAIDYLVRNFEALPSLEDVAAEVGLSASHFQRVFKAGAGVSPKRFMQFLAANEAKGAFRRGETVLDAALSVGLSGPSRLHDLFLVSEAMTPGAFRRKGEGVLIRHAFVTGPFGETLLGATEQGVCWLNFSGVCGRQASLDEMKLDWPAAEFLEDREFVAPLARSAFAFARGERIDRPLGLYVQGTNFQLKVWEALLRIPFGETVTYGDVAGAVDTPSAGRAVGAAIGANMVSLLIPCHRVILSSGIIHNYRWGVGRKKALLAMEAAIRAGIG